MRVLVLAACLASVTCADSQPHRGCTLIGCDAVARLEVIRVADAASLDNTYLDLCINARCAHVLISNSSPNPAALEFVADFRAHAEIDAHPDGSTVVTAIVREADNLVAGDVYRVTLSRLDNSVIATRTWRATAYSYTYPNGPGCNECVTPTLEPQ
jgi:hypothetical protein